MSLIVGEQFQSRLPVVAQTAAVFSAANPVLRAGQVGYETDTGIRRIGDGTTTYLNLPLAGDVVPYCDLTAATNQTLWRAAWPMQPSGAAGTALTALREHWFLCSWKFGKPATVGGINVIGAVASSSVVVGVYLLASGNLPGVQTGRYVLDSASTGIKEFTLAVPWRPNTWRWVCLYTEGAVTLISSSPTNAALHPLGNASSSPVGSMSRSSIAVGNSAPSTPPAISAMTPQNITVPCLFLRPAA